MPLLSAAVSTIALKLEPAWRCEVARFTWLWPFSVSLP